MRLDWNWPRATIAKRLEARSAERSIAFAPCLATGKAFLYDAQTMQIDLDHVAALLREKYSVQATVEQTGGGIATILAGPGRRGRAAILAGPGHYGWNERPSVADTEELSVAPDDDGVSPAVPVPPHADEDVVAAMIACAVHARSAR